MNPKVSIVIVNYNGERFIKDCLDSLYTQTFGDFETVFVDNRSSDRSIDIVTKKYPNVFLIRNKANLGFAEGTNIGIRAAKGEYVLTLNNDTQLEPNFLTEIILPMHEDPQVGICASKMLLPDGRINSTGLIVSRSGAAWNRGMFEEDRRQYEQQEEVFGASAGAALFRRSMLDEIGLFDEDFFMYMEDVDLSFRACLAGWKCIYVPNAVVYHHHGGTTNFQSDMAVYHGNRNIIWMVLKNYPSCFLLLSMPWIIGRNIGVIGYYIFKGHGKTILHAKVDALCGIPRMREKRRSIQRNLGSEMRLPFFYTWACNQGI